MAKPRRIKALVLATFLILAGAVFLLFIRNANKIPTGNTLPRGENQLALLNNAPDSRGDIYILNTETQEVVQLTRGHMIWGASWSPDGEQMLLVAWNGQYFEQYLFNPSTATLTLLDLKQISVNSPIKWSPDGTQLAFSGDGHIYVISSDGIGLKQLAEGESPAWSPDGSQIVFVTKSEQGTDQFTSDIHTIQSDGSQNHTLLTFPGEIYRPSWSPDGSRILFLEIIRKNYGIQGANLYLTDTNGSPPQLLELPEQPSTEYPPVSPYWPPAWSPNGEEILIKSNFTNTYIYSLKTGEFISLHFGEYPVWNLTGDGVAFQKVGHPNTICQPTAELWDRSDSWNALMPCIDINTSIAGETIPIGWRP